MIHVPRSQRARTETDLVREVRAALMALGFVRVFRNNVTTLRDSRGIPITSGLGTGSADLVGYVRTLDMRPVMPIARFFALEIKLPKTPTRRGGVLSAAQAAWGQIVAEEGGYWAVATSADEAVEHAIKARFFQ